MIENDKTDRIRSIIGWMRKNITLSLDGYRPGWERASKLSNVKLLTALVACVSRCVIAQVMYYDPTITSPTDTDAQA